MKLKEIREKFEISLKINKALLVTYKTGSRVLYDPINETSFKVYRIHKNGLIRKDPICTKTLKDLWKTECDMISVQFI